MKGLAVAKPFFFVGGWARLWARMGTPCPSVPTRPSVTFALQRAWARRKRRPRANPCRRGPTSSSPPQGPQPPTRLLAAWVRHLAGRTAGPDGLPTRARCRPAGLPSPCGPVSGAHQGLVLGAAQGRGQFAGAQRPQRTQHQNEVAQHLAARLCHGRVQPGPQAGWSGGQSPLTTRLGLVTIRGQAGNHRLARSAFTSNPAPRRWRTAHSVRSRCDCHRLLCPEARGCECAAGAPKPSACRYGCANAHLRTNVR